MCECLMSIGNWLLLSLYVCVCVCVFIFSPFWFSPFLFCNCYIYHAWLDTVTNCYIMIVL